MERSIEKFQEITNFPLSNFIVEADSFFNNEFNDIVAFFSGNRESLNKGYITKLNSLSEKAQYIQQIFRSRKDSLDSIEFWELLDAIEDIKVKLSTTQNISKYLRSSIVKGTEKAGFVFDTIMRNDETLEDINLHQLKENDEESWFDIAFDNDLKEIDWDIAGGKELKIRKRVFQIDAVTSMVDNTIGEKIYGRDLNRTLTFKDDDLETLSYKETAIQTVDILAALSKGDIPEYRNLGMDHMLYKGSNFSKLNYSSIVRELNKNFATDDLFVDFKIRDIKYEEGDVFIEFEVGTKYELIVIKNIKI